MTVRSQPVQVATADGNDAVIASGLQPGMVIVSAGVHVLAPGTEGLGVAGEDSQAHRRWPRRFRPHRCRRGPGGHPPHHPLRPP